jgi:hypothetical protein
MLHEPFQLPSYKMYCEMRLIAPDLSKTNLRIHYNGLRAVNLADVPRLTLSMNCTKGRGILGKSLRREVQSCRDGLLYLRSW